MTHFTLEDDQIAIRDMARDFAAETLAPKAVEWDQEKHFPVDVLREAAALGMGGVYVRDDVGGSGLSRLDAALIFAPVGALVPAALRVTVRGGTVVCAGIHMSDIPSFPYSILWGERKIVSVANLTRRDAEEFLELAPKVPVQTHTEIYPLIEANRALSDLRDGRLQGAAVLVP